MSEKFPGSLLDDYLREVREQENHLLEQAREDFLVRHMFTDDFFTASPMEAKKYGISHRFEMEQLRHKFSIEKKGKNFGESFAMAISPEYLGKLHVIELGVTQDGLGGLEDLRRQFSDLHNFLKQNKLTGGILPRDDCGRFYDVKSSKVKPPDTSLSPRMVLTRIRPLLGGTFITSHNQVASITQVKMTTFSIPANFYVSLGNRYGVQCITKSEAWQIHMDDLLDEGAHMQHLIDPIRTGYYQATELVDAA